MVQRYLRFMGVVDRPRDWSFRARFVGRFRMRPGMGWMPAEAWQYNSAITVARLFVMRVRFAGVVPMTGKDIYIDGHGRMLGKLLGLITVADGKGEESDIGELTTYLNDALLLAPSFLLRPEVTWAEVDANAFDVTLHDAGRSVSGRVHIDERGVPIDFATNDRFAALPEGPRRAEWRTPISEWVQPRTADACPGSSVPSGTFPKGSSPTSRAGSTQRASPSTSRRPPRRQGWMPAERPSEPGLRARHVECIDMIFNERHYSTGPAPDQGAE